MLTTPQRNCVSWKKVMQVVSSRLMPVMKPSRQATSNTRSSSEKWSPVPVISITSSRGTSASRKLIIEDATREIG